MPRRIIISLTVFALGALAQNSLLRASPPIGAVVQNWHYDPQTNRVTAQIVNVSHKDITAYNISIKESYANGVANKHEQLTDTVGALSFIQEMKGTANEDNVRKQLGGGLFHPGETRNEMFGVQPGLTNFEATVDVVVYADQTTEATNNDGLQRIVAQRKRVVATRQATDDIIKAALADPNDSNPAATAAKQIQDRITVLKAQKHTAAVDFDPGIAKGIVDELNGISSRFFNKRGALSDYLAKNENRIATLSPHTNLKIGAQP